MSLEPQKEKKKGVVRKKYLKEIMGKTPHIWWKIETYGLNQLSKPQIGQT